MKHSLLNYLIEKINESTSCTVKFNRINKKDSKFVCRIKIEWSYGFTHEENFESIKECEIYLSGYHDALLY